MKSIFAFVLALVFLLNIGGKIVVYVNFYLNQEYIANNLCENRDKPVLQCNGKCQLMKELNEEDKKEKKEDKHKFENTNVYFFCAIEPITELNPLFFEKKEHANANVQARRVGYRTKVFHPPSLS